MRKVAEHTPGPWQVHAAGCAHVPPYVRVAKFWPQAGAYQIIADCSHEVTHGTECEANARLIAAAPDLLEALHSAVASLEQLVAINRMPANNKGLRDARAAIAKAEGRTNA